MKLLGFAYLAVLLGVNSATAQTTQMQLNYYSDSACSAYDSSIDVTWATTVTNGVPGPNCYDNNGGSSVDIANCYENACACIFYTEASCQGSQTYAFSNDTNCLANSASQYSFECWYQ